MHDDSLACQQNDTILAPDTSREAKHKQPEEEDPMQSMTRRNVVLSAAVAGAAFGLNKSLEIISPAAAQQGGGPTALNPKGT